MSLFIKCSLHCLTVNGIPLFTKNVGDVPSIPFPVIGSLNGVHMFSKSKEVEMGCTNTESGKIYWKEFGSIKLILIIMNDICQKYLELLLDNIYKSMVMSIGENDLNKGSNIERLKKKIKLCLPLLDSLMEPLNLMSTFTQMTEIIYVLNINVLRNYLTSFTEEFESEFGCIMIDGKIVIATDKFWQLQTVETSLLSFVVSDKKNLTSSDTPIYLPNGSPTIPHRLITIKLVDRLHIAFVCGPEPSLQEVLNKHIIHYWSPLVPSLRECIRSLPRSFPPEIKLDPNVLSFLLLNITDGQSLFSLYTHGNSTAADIDFMSNVSNRRNSLINFYFSINKIYDNDVNEMDRELCKVKESYQCFSTHKCYVLKSSSFEIYVLFSNTAPTYTMGLLTRLTLKQLTIKERT